MKAHNTNFAILVSILALACGTGCAADGAADDAAEPAAPAGEERTAAPGVETTEPAHAAELVRGAQLHLAGHAGQVPESDCALAWSAKPPHPSPEPEIEGAIMEVR